MTDSGRGTDGAPDLQTQFEDLLSHVLHCETWARLEDRIDLAIGDRRTPGDELPQGES